MCALNFHLPVAQAVEHRKAGRLAEAEAVCRQILAAQPGNADALHELGSVAYARKQYSTLR